MITNDHRIHQKHLQTQIVFIPSLEAWLDILRDGYLDEMPVKMLDWVEYWLSEYGNFKVAYLGLVQSGEKWSPLPLLYLKEKYFRVHFENVICEHCNRRCGHSAKPETVAYANTGLTTSEVWAEFDILPLQHCPHCGVVLRQRQTIWLAS